MGSREEDYARWDAMVDSYKKLPPEALATALVGVLGLLEGDEKIYHRAMILVDIAVVMSDRITAEVG